MKVYLEFHEIDKSISAQDFEMNSEEITALLNAGTLLWPFEEREKNAVGEVFESYFNPFKKFLLVRIREVKKQEQPIFSFE